MSGKYQGQPLRPVDADLKKISRLNWISILVILICLTALGFISSVTTIDLTIPATGELASSEFSPVNAQAEGVIATVNFKEGDLVEAGDILAVLENPELKNQLNDSLASLEVAKAQKAKLEQEMAGRKNILEAEIHSAETKLETLRNSRPSIVNVLEARVEKTQVRESQALTEYEKAKELLEKELISGKKEEEAKRSYELAKADTKVALAEKESELQKNESETRQTASSLEEAKTKLLELEDGKKEIETLAAEIKKVEISVESLKKKFDELKISAPISGRFLTPDADRLVGKAVSVGETVFKLGSAGDLVVDARLSEEYLPQVVVGQDAKIYLPSLPYRKYQVFTGKIKQIGSTFNRLEDETTGNKRAYVPIKVDLDTTHVIAKEKTIYLKPGLTAEVEVITDRGKVLSLLWDKILRWRSEL